MANVILNEEHLTNIANAIRSKKGTRNNMYPRDMASEISGIFTGIDTTNATAVSGDILNGKTAYAKGEKVTGTMMNIGTQNGDITTKNQNLNILKGYHDGKGYVGIAELEKQKIIPENIKNGVSILGVTGNLQTGVAGKQVKTGTTSSPTINTGLNKIDNIILIANKFYSTGLVSLVYSGGSPMCIFCTTYGYEKICELTPYDGVVISGGTFKWTGERIYAFMFGATYDWIAIGT